LFWFVLVVALAVGWWLDHRQLAPKAELVEPLQAKLKFEANDAREIVDVRERIREQFEELFKANHNLTSVITQIRLRDPKLVEEAQKIVFGEPDNQK
jgi:hypothetical protein